MKYKNSILHFMKKELYIEIIIFIILCIIAVLMLINKSSTDLKEVSLEENEEIILEIDEKSITSTGLTLIITDNSDINISWSEDYEIQQKIDGVWIDLVPKREMFVPGLASTKDENNQVIQRIYWVPDYGTLENGTYRIVKPWKNLYSDEFIINE